MSRSLLAGQQASNAGSAISAAESGKDMKKNKKKCEESKAMGKPDPKACKRSAMSGGQMLGSLGQLAQGLMAAMSAGQKGGGSPKGFGAEGSSPYYPTVSGQDYSDYPSESELQQASENPMDAFSNRDFAQSALKGTGLTQAQIDDLVRSVRSAKDSGVEVDEAEGVIKSSLSEDLPMSSLSSPSGLASLGFSAQDIQDMVKEQADVAEKIDRHLKSLKLSDGGGGGGGSKAKSYSLPDYSGNYGYRSKAALNQLGTKDPNKVWSRRFGNDRIGIASDNIFKMVSKRYLIKYRAKRFLP